MIVSPFIATKLVGITISRYLQFISSINQVRAMRGKIALPREKEIDITKR